MLYDEFNIYSLKKNVIKRVRHSARILMCCDFYKILYNFLITVFVKLRLTGELQRRTHLEDQKAELAAANMEYEREIKVSVV